MLQQIQQLQALAALLLRQFSSSYRRQKALVSRARLAILEDRMDGYRVHLIRARSQQSPRPACRPIKALLEWRADNHQWLLNNPWRSRHEHSS
jgi:hypothetical protein